MVLPSGEFTTARLAASQQDVHVVDADPGPTHNAEFVGGRDYIGGHLRAGRIIKASYSPMIDFSSSGLRPVR